MAQISFNADWLDVSGVNGAELAATWASLRIQAGDSIITKVIAPDTNKVRDSVFAPLYPLAEWFATNWWHFAPVVLTLVDLLNLLGLTQSSAGKRLSRLCGVLVLIYETPRRQHILPSTRTSPSPTTRLPQKPQRPRAIQPIVDELIAVAPQAAIAA